MVRTKFFYKMLAIAGNIVYNSHCCDIDSEEARGCHHKYDGFSVERMSRDCRIHSPAVGKPDGKSLYEP